MTEVVKCQFCGKEILPKDYFESNMSYSYDVRGSHSAGKKSEYFKQEWLYDSHKSCWNNHWKESTKYWDEVDEVMNRNKYFIREKGMIGKYKDGDTEYGPVYAYWKRANIEGYFICEPLGEEREALHKFQEWLKTNNVTYKYESR